MVGRPREFDTDLALDAAMRAFWTRGYEATSLNDLMQATGLHKGSLYQAFGDKHALFVQALKRYLEDMRRQKNEILAQAPTPLDGLRAVGHAIIDIADDDCDCPKGCLALNTLIELAPHDEEVRKVMFDHMQRMRQSLAAVVAKGQAAGQIRKDQDPEQITSLMMIFVAGLGTMVKARLSKAEAHALLDAQIRAVV